VVRVALIFGDPLAAWADVLRSQAQRNEQLAILMAVYIEKLCRVDFEL
jgi:hypothetical protein